MRIFLVLCLLCLFTTIFAQIVPPQNLEAVLDQDTGEVDLSWSHQSGESIYEDFEDGSADNWIPVNDNWNVVEGVYTAENTDHYRISSYYDQEFTNYTIESRLRKASGSINTVGFFFNGDPSSIDESGAWMNCYQISLGVYNDYATWF